jgi:MOSC domain-containing protein YiiM
MRLGIEAGGASKVPPNLAFKQTPNGRPRKGKNKHDAIARPAVWRRLTLLVRPHQPMSTQVVAIHRKREHAFSKTAVPAIELVPGHGVRDDAHYGVTVKHRSRVAKDPTQPNLRQVHLLHEELLTEAAAHGHQVLPGQLGENITTRGIKLLALGTGTRLKVGAHAVVEITGLRNPCSQIENFQAGLLSVVVGRAPDGSLIRKAGVMAIVLEGGLVHPGDEIEVVHEPSEYKALVPV